MNIILCESVEKETHTASKARLDTEKIVQSKGYSEITLFHKGHARIAVLFEILHACIKTLTLVNKNDTIFIQYPYYPRLVNWVIFSILFLGKKLKGYYVIMLIHDVPSLREGNMNSRKMEISLRSEVRSWRWMDYVICHSYNMRNIFESVSRYNRYIVLGPFDYLYDGPLYERKYAEHPVVMIAGYLGRSKSAYIYNLKEIKDTRFDLYGPEYTGDTEIFIRYRGEFNPEQLIVNLDGQYGLVWDGESIDTCSGGTGEYLKYNSPYKFSLYIAAGVPVILWEKSALADYVKVNGIGFTVGSLKDLKENFNRVTEREYYEMVNNVLKIRSNIVHGCQLCHCLDIPVY